MKFNVHAKMRIGSTTLLQGTGMGRFSANGREWLFVETGTDINVNTDTYQAELIEYNQLTDVLLWINGKLNLQQSLLEINQHYGEVVRHQIYL